MAPHNPGIILVYTPTASPHLNVIENAWGIHRHMSRFAFHSKKEFQAATSEFLRTHRFYLDVMGKLDSRLDPAAEARVLEARKLSDPLN